LLAKKDHIQWNPDLIYFDNTRIVPTANYFVQQLFSQNSGDTYYDNIISFANESDLSASCVSNSKTKKVFLKIVNTGKTDQKVAINTSSFKRLSSNAVKTELTGNARDKNTFESPEKVLPVTNNIKIKAKMNLLVPANSLTIIKLTHK